MFVEEKHQTNIDKFKGGNKAMWVFFGGGGFLGSGTMHHQNKHGGHECTCEGGVRGFGVFLSVCRGNRGISHSRNCDKQR